MAECNHCGSFVTDDYARVFGDNENRVDDCRNCPTVRSSTEESDDGHEVLLRDVRGPASRERDEDDETAGAPETETETAPTDSETHTPARGVDTDEPAGGPVDGTAAEDTDDDEDEGGVGRIQSGLSAMVSALRS